uniref:Protein YIPF n=1 Tax=Plectus sambesii TaxID=2011161 RepID=A0A914V3C6_9BILA
MQVTNDMYGPLMLILTLVALLLYTMKSSGYTVQDGTLVGTAFVTCFSYWLFTSIAIYTLCYIFTCDVQMVQVFSLLGYSLFGHCIVVLLTAVFHPVHSHLFFYALLMIFAGPSCARMAVFLASKTREKSHKLILTAVIFFVHLSFLTYLHFGFHTIVEEIDEIFGEGVGVHIATAAAQVIPGAAQVLPGGADSVKVDPPVALSNV